MSRILAYTFLTIHFFSVSLGKNSTKEKEAWSAKVAGEGHCIKDWPNQDDVVDIDWFEKYMLKGFRVPMASEMYYHKYATKLSLIPLNGTSDLNELCLRVTNNPNAVYTALTDTPLPNNWQYYASDPNSGGIFYKLANQTKHFYFKKFYLVHQGYGGSVVESCVTNKDKVYLKECKKNEKQSGSSAASVDGDKIAKHEGNRWMITKTDNKNYAVVVNCFPKLNRKAWHVLSVNETLDKPTKKAIISHIKALGFKKEKVIEVTYEERICAEMQQPIMMAT